MKTEEQQDQNSIKTETRGRPAKFPDPKTMTVTARRTKRNRLKKMAQSRDLTPPELHWLALDRTLPKKPEISKTSPSDSVQPDLPLQPSTSAGSSETEAAPCIRQTEPASAEFPPARDASEGSVPPDSARPGFWSRPQDGAKEASAAPGAAPQPGSKEPPKGADGKPVPGWREMVADQAQAALCRINADLASEGCMHLPSEQLSLTHWALTDLLYEKIPEGETTARNLRDGILAVNIGGTLACMGIRAFLRWRRQKAEEAGDDIVKAHPVMKAAAKERSDNGTGEADRVEADSVGADSVGADRVGAAAGRLPETRFSRLISSS